MITETVAGGIIVLNLLNRVFGAECAKLKPENMSGFDGNADRRCVMAENVIIKAALRKRFEKAWNDNHVILFSAPCGFGKTTTAMALLSGRTVCVYDAAEHDFREDSIDFSCEVILIDNLHKVNETKHQHKICNIINEHPENHFVFLSRGILPGWLLTFKFTGRMTVFEYEELMFSREETGEMLALHGIIPQPIELAEMHDKSKGYPLALNILCRLIGSDAKYTEQLDSAVRRELFRYYQEAVYNDFEIPMRRMLLDLASFEYFDSDFAKMVSGNSQAGELVGKLLRETTMILFDGVKRYHFWPLFRQYLLWQQDQDYSDSEQKALYSRAALYYEIHEDYAKALECYLKCGEYRKISDVLIKNSELHPGLAYFEELEPYYRSLPKEEILSSPVLMFAMSMLCAVCLDYEESEKWYAELENYASRLKKTNAEYKIARGRLAYLDIGLPQRSVSGITDIIKSAASLLINKQISIPEFSVTSGLPSIMNGGKDFCEWSRKDDFLYATMRKPVEILLRSGGVGLPECAVAESKFEKGEDISARMLDMVANLGEVQRKGTPDMEFAMVGLLARMQVDQGRAVQAKEHIEALKARFEEQKHDRFLPNISAMLCRIALRTEDTAAVERWYREDAPKDLLRLRGMKRYQYMTRAMTELNRGDVQTALLILTALRPYFESCGRTMDEIHLNILTAVSRCRNGDEWKPYLKKAVRTCEKYDFIRPISQYGAAALPLLVEYRKEDSGEFLKRITEATRMQAINYPHFLQNTNSLTEPLSNTELQVLKLLCHNKSNAEIGEILGIKLTTVKTHVSHILYKLNVKRRSEAKAAAERLRIL